MNGALTRPKTTTSNWQASYQILKVVMFLQELAIPSCQYSLKWSSVLNNFKPRRSSNTFSGRVSGQGSAFVARFQERYSTQNLRFRCSFEAIVTGNDHGADTGTIILASRRLSSSLRMNSLCFGGHYERSMTKRPTICEPEVMLHNSISRRGIARWPSDCTWSLTLSRHGLLRMSIEMAQLLIEIW